MNALTSNNLSNLDCAVHKIYCGSQIPLTTGELELCTSHIKHCYFSRQTIKPNKLSGLCVPNSLPFNTSS